MKPKANLAAELNMLRQQSSVLLDVASQKRLLLKSNLSVVDKYLHAPAVLEEIETVTKRFSVDLSKGKYKGNVDR